MIIRSLSFITEEINAHYIKFDCLLSAEKVEIYMGMLHWESKIPLLRCKGLYIAQWSNGSINQFMLQGVDDTFECRKLTTLSDDITDFSNKFLFVGRNINKDEIEQALKEWR